MKIWPELNALTTPKPINIITGIINAILGKPNWLLSNGIEASKARERPIT